MVGREHGRRSGEAIAGGEIFRDGERENKK